MGVRITVELLLDQRTLFLVKEFNINIPEVCIQAVIAELSRQQDVRQACQISSPTKENEELRQALRKMRIEKEKLMERMMMVAR